MVNKKFTLDSMIEYLGKKVDLTCVDGKKFEAYVYDILNGEDSDIGSDAVELAPIDALYSVVIALDEVADIQIDDRFITIDFWG